MSGISAGETIVQAMVDALNKPADKPCVCYRSRVDAFAQAELPAMVLYAVEETGVIKGPDTMLRTRHVVLELLVSGEPPADQKIDPLYVYAVQALQADATLAPLLRKLHDAHIQWETEPSVQDVAAGLVKFEAVYVTKLTDPTGLIT